MPLFSLGFFFPGASGFVYLFYSFSGPLVSWICFFPVRLVSCTFFFFFLGASGFVDHFFSGASGFVDYSNIVFCSCAGGAV